MPENIKNVSLEEASALLKSFDNIMVVSHANPDGDTLGSATALLHVLENAGKRACFKCSDAIDRKFSYLFEGLKLECGEEEAENIVTVDVADPKLLGNVYKLYSEKPELFKLAVDHHATHVPFALNEHIEGGEPSNCEIMYRLFKVMDAEITPAVANALYTGVATDTGCFKYASVKPETHIIAAELMQVATDVSEINRVMFDTKTKSALLAEREALEGMQYYCDDKVALISVPIDLKTRTGASDAELDFLPSLPRSVEGVIVGITLKQKSENVWKASVRAVKPADASAICKQLGGGGHTGAAGCTLENCNLEEATEVIVAETEKHLKSVL